MTTKESSKVVTKKKITSTTPISTSNVSTTTVTRRKPLPSLSVPNKPLPSLPSLPKPFKPLPLPPSPIPQPPVISKPLPSILPLPVISSPTIKDIKPFATIQPPSTPQFKRAGEDTVVTNQEYSAAIDALAKYKTGDSYNIQGILSANDPKLNSAVSTLFPDVNIAEIRKQSNAINTLSPYLDEGDYDIYAIVASGNASVLSAAKFLFPDLTQAKIKDIKEKGDWLSKEPIDIYAYVQLTPEQREGRNPIKPRDAQWYADEIQRLKKKYGWNDVTGEERQKITNKIDWEMRHYYIKSQGVSPDLPDVKYDSPAAQKVGIYKDPKQSVNPFIQASAYIGEFAANSAHTLRGYIGNVPGPAPMQQVYKFAGSTAIGALVELPLMLVNIPIMAMAFGGEFYRGATKSGEHGYQKMVIPAFIASTAYATEIARGMGQWFADLPSNFMKDPAYTTGNLIGLFAISPGGLLKLGKVARLHTLTPRYFDLLRVPNRLGTFRLSGTAEKVAAGGWGHVPNMSRAVNEAMIKLAKLSEEAIIAKKPLPKSVRVQVEPGLFITLETPLLWKYLGPYMTHGGDAAAFMMNEAYPHFLVGGKLRPNTPLYTSPVFAPRFSKQAGIGTIHKNPSFGMIFGKGGKLDYLNFTDKVIRDATETTGRAIEVQGIVPVGTMLYRVMPESYLKGGALIKYANLRSRLLKGKAGELIRIEEGKTYPIHMYSIDPAVAPMKKIGIAELGAMHLESARLSLRDLLKDPLRRQTKKGLTIDFKTLEEYAHKADTSATSHISQGTFHGDVIGKDGKFIKLRDGYWHPDSSTGGYVRTTNKGTLVDTEGFVYAMRDRADPLGYFEEFGGAIHELNKIQPGGGPGIAGITRERAFWVQVWNEAGISPRNIQVVSPYLGKSSRHSIKGGYQTVGLIDHNAKFDVFANQPKGMKMPEATDFLRTNGYRTEIWNYNSKKWKPYTKRKVEVSPHLYDVWTGHFESRLFETYVKNATGKIPKTNYSNVRLKIHSRTPSELLKQANRQKRYDPYKKIQCSLCVAKPRKAAEVENKYRKNIDKFIDEEIVKLLDDNPRYEALYKKYPKKFEERYQEYLYKYMEETYKRPDYMASYRRRGGNGKAEWERYAGIRTSDIVPDSYYRAYGEYAYDFPLRGYPSLRTTLKAPYPRTPIIPVTPYPRVPKPPDISYLRVPVVPSPTRPRVPRVPEDSYPRVPRVPPPEQPRVPVPKVPIVPKIPVVPKIPITPKVLIPRIPPLAFKGDGSKRRFPMDSFAWKQGFGWWVSSPPYSGTIGKDMIFTRTKPAGVPIGRTPAQTITKLGINVPKGNVLDLGIMDVHIGNKGKSIKYKKDRRQKTKQGKVIGMPPGIVGARGR